MIPDLVVDAAAAFRITRLVTADDLLDEPRGNLVKWAYTRGRTPGALVDVERRMTAVGYEWGRPADWSAWAMHDPDCPKLATLITCRWCCGWWVSVGVVIARRVAPRAWRRVAEAFALSAAAALLAGLEG